MTQLNAYVTGPVRGRNTDQLNEFVLVREKLEKLGFSVTTAADDLPVGDQHDDGASKDKWMQQRQKNLEAADVVITIEQYEYDDVSIAEVHYARDHRIEVSSAVAFIFKYQKAAATA